MSKYIGKRIVPKHCGEWNKDIPYEMLSIVLHTESGESYISRCEVPAGTELLDGRYWAVCSRFSQQIKDMETHLQETESRMNTNLSETETRMAEDLHSTKASMSEELGVTAERLNHTVEATKQTLGQRVDEACEDLAEGKKEMESTARRLEARLDANVSASTKRMPTMQPSLSTFVSHFLEKTTIQRVLQFGVRWNGWRTGSGNLLTRQPIKQRKPVSE